MVDVKAAVLEEARRVRIALGEQHVAVGLTDAVRPRDQRAARYYAPTRERVVGLSSGFSG